MQNFLALRAPPQAPSLRQLRASPPDPHWPPAAGGSTPRPPKQPLPHCEFLATRLFDWEGEANRESLALTSKFLQEEIFNWTKIK